MPNVMAEYAGDSATSESDAPKSEKDTPITEDGQPQNSGDSLHIPAEFLQGTKFEAGDEVVLKVISADEDGIEVEYASMPMHEKGMKGRGMNMRESANAELDAIDQEHGGMM